MKDKEKVPSHHELMWPTLEAIKLLGGSGTNEEILDKIVEIESIPEKIQNYPHTNSRMTKLEYRAAWARSYLKKAGAVDNSKVGVWTITKFGEKTTVGEIQERIKQDRKEYLKKRKEIVSDDYLPDEEVEEIYDWQAQLLDIIKSIKPDAFERLCQRLLRESGFIKVQITGRPNDGGIDGVGVLRINLLSFQVFFQCKRYKGSVGSSAIRDFRGAMIGRCDKGLIITTGSFTSEARKEATRDGAPAIDLIDGEELCELLKRLKLGVDIKLVEEVTIKPEWFNEF